MSEVDYGAVIQKTRSITSAVLVKSLENPIGKSEVDIRDEILKGLSQHNELYPTGWYDPPSGGVSVLFGNAPFERLRYDTLRNPTFWPSAEWRFDAETVGFVYASPVDRATGMLGDAGFTVYAGTDVRVRDHIRTCFEAIREVAEHARAGMQFSELYAFGTDTFHRHDLEVTKWMTATNDPSKVGLGHTVPGSYGDVTLPDDFEGVKDAITTGRKYVSAIESLVIPDTVAFTVEARLVNRERQDLPCFFHFMVIFSDGKKVILSDFDAIFRAIGMDYLL